MPSPKPKVPPLPLLPHDRLLPSLPLLLPLLRQPPTPPTQTQPPLRPSHPAATDTANATTADRYRADGAHVYAHARKRKHPADTTLYGQNVNTPDAPPAEKHRNTAKAEAKLEKALEYLATLNTTATAKPDKWVVNASILASMTGCYRPAINTFIEARKQRIDELNAAHGLGPGHNRATARTHPNAIPDLVKRFKEEVLGQPF